MARSKQTVTRDAHWIEWMTGAISGLIVLAMTAWIAYHAVTDAGGKPELSIAVLESKAVAKGYEITLTVDNRGNRTAAAVPVTGELVDDGTQIETHTIVFDYVPTRSSVTGAILFEADPSAHELHLRIDGYADP